MKTFSLSFDLDNTPIFAYMRKSTNKQEQELSLVQQEEWISELAKHLWVDLSRIKTFAETHSGFENKKRPRWNEMLKEIDRLKVPCILLARDTSRLSRNQKDNLAITDRLYWDNWHKMLIKGVYFLWKGFTVEEWNCKTNKKMVTDKLKQNYDESLETKDKSLNWVMLKLTNKEYTYWLPTWLLRKKINGKWTMYQNDKMKIVYRAFEMKTEGKSHKEISRYLFNVWGIKIWERDLTDRLFKNTVYIWSYTEKNSWITFSSLEFLEKRPPIPMSLWNQVQKCLWKKLSQYGAGQEWNVLTEKLRTEEWRRMSVYYAKGKYPNYKNTIEKIHLKEGEILWSYIMLVRSVIESNRKRFGKAFNDEITRIYGEPKYIDTSMLTASEVKIDATGIILTTNPGKNMTLRNFVEAIKSSPYYNKLLEDEKYITQHIDELTKTKDERMTAKVKLTKKFAMDLIDEEMYKETLKDIDLEIKTIESEILESSKTSELEKYIDRLPEILLKTFELASNSISKAENADFKEDVLKLIELSTFELTINNKKELKIKLFPVLDKLVSSDLSLLEAPSGVEPLYEALQAPT